jgi:protoporphyrin/coproporphyrin ferrochelatase
VFAPNGVLLVNLGSPRSPEEGDVGTFLAEFLGDPEVIDLPAPLRFLLLRLVILPFRPRKSAAAYRKIWTAEGSPLIRHSLSLAARLADRLGSAWRVECAMRYGEPKVAPALERLRGVSRLVVVPLYPQYATSTTRSTETAVAAAIAATGGLPAPELRGAFYADAGFQAALAEAAAPGLAAFRPDHVLMSFHGLPASHIRKVDPTGAHCLARPECCDAIGEANPDCYRAQCAATSRLLARGLGLAPDRFSLSFQSRLSERWIRPHTDKVLPELRARGVRRLAVVCPSFVADCLETVEEIGIRARDQWRALGGDALHLAPCVNDHPRFVEALAAIVAFSPS